MRLITRRQIYRAFPELDRFDDERCIRFVRAANSGRWKSARRIAIFFAGVIGFFAVMSVVGGMQWYTGRKLSGIRNDRWFFAITGGIIVLHFAAAAAASLWTRDLLLRRRIRMVVRDRGVCLGCHYSLIGLFVDENHRVKCPECGQITEVDPSLGELASGEDGRPLFKPEANLLVLQQPNWFTPKRVKWIKRSIAGLIIGIPLFLGLLVGGYEMFLRWQASVAQRERPGPEGLRAYAANGAAGPSGAAPSTPGSGPVAESNESDAWKMFEWMERERQQIEAGVRLPDEGAGIGSMVWPEYSIVGKDEPSQAERDRMPDYAKHRDAAIMLLKAFREAGWFERSDQIIEAKMASWPVDFSRDDSAASGVLLLDMGPARNWARIQAGRMIQAREADDPAEFARALETTFTLSWMMKMRPLMISRLVGDAIDALAMVGIRDVLTRRPDARWLDAIEGVLDRRRPDPSLDYTLGGEELFVLDTVGWVFGKPGRVRLGRYSSEIRAMTQNDYRLALGTYARNRDIVKALFKDARAQAGVPLHQRVMNQWTRTGYILPDTLGVNFDSLLKQHDFVKLELAGTRVMIALERHRLAHGSYPETLESLAPGSLAEAPIDPWSGVPLEYRLVDPAADPQGRGYLLYSVGADKMDDGAVNLNTSMWSQPFHRAVPGYDLIINDRKR